MDFQGQTHQCQLSVAPRADGDEVGATGQDTRRGEHGRSHDEALWNAVILHSEPPPHVQDWSIGGSGQAPRHVQGGREQSQLGRQAVEVGEGKCRQHEGILGSFTRRPLVRARTACRWVRIHSIPRVAMFDQWRAQNGPGRKTRLRPS